MAPKNIINGSLNLFAAQLYQKIIESQANKFNNCFICPASIFTALSMTQAGCEGATQDELLRVLHLPRGMADIHGTIGQMLIKNIKQPGSVQLSSANGFFLIQSAMIQKDYVQMLQKFYDSTVEELNQLPTDEAKCAHINQWTSAATAEKINEIIPLDSLTSETLLILINALYFKGEWMTPFPEGNTLPGTFYRHDSTPVGISLMNHTATFPYLEMPDIAAHALKLPFAGDESWEMLIVLPFENNGLPKVQWYLQQPMNFSRLLSEEFIRQNVIVSLPKFKLSKGQGMDVVEILKAMGVRSIFDPSKANLSRMSTEPNLFVSAIYHKAILEVDEKGATAAAATAVRVSNRSAARIDPIFKVNHPFFVAILHETFIPVFIGHVWEPEENVTK